MPSTQVQTTLTHIMEGIVIVTGRSYENVTIIAALEYPDLLTNNTFPSGGWGGSYAGHDNLLDGDLEYAMVVIFYFVLQIPVLPVGMATNILNVVIFTMSGQRDSVSIALTALSMSDLVYVTIYMTVRVLDLLSRIFDIPSRVALGPWGIANYLAFLAHVFQDTSVVITVFVALQKCCCVAIPHLFKDVFTPRRTVIIILCLCASMAATSVPILHGLVFTTRTFPDNSTLTVLSFTTLFRQSTDMWLIFNRLTLPAASQVVTVICIIIMVRQLRISARFRSSAADQTSSGNESKRSSGKLGPKERRAVTAVTLVSTIFVVSTLPMTVVSYAMLLAPLFFKDPRNGSFLQLLNNCQSIPVHISASANIFIYLRYNTKFKQTADSLFGRCPCVGGDLEKTKGEEIEG